MPIVFPPTTNLEASDMAIDQYAICPCGSGKKIKFCKCFDSIGELDRVMKMVQGGQMVAAIDRLNQIFKQHPTAAWALAIKGRLLIGMDELPNLAENAERFIQLQPSNPLALAQKAAAEVGQERFSHAAHSILQSLAESGQTVDSFIIEICGLLAVGLLRDGNLLSSRMFATIALMASQDEQYQRLPRMVLEELNGSTELNLLLKTLPTTIQRPADVSWGERFDEAQGLLYSNQILASESKLEALDRQHPGEPAIMLSLFVCSIWRADKDSQARLLAKVSDAMQNDAERSTRLLAVSWLLASKSQSIDVDVKSLTYQVEDVEKAILELTAQPKTDALGSQFLQRAANADGIHPRAAFVVLNNAPVTGDLLSLDLIDKLPQVLGIAFVYGRQTDREPEIIVQHVQPSDMGQVVELLNEVLGIAAPTSEETEQIPLDAALNPRVHLPKSAQMMQPNHDVMNEMLRRHLCDRVIGFQLSCVDGKSLADLMNDPAMLKQRTALVRVVQGNMHMAAFNETTEAFSEKVGVPPLSTLNPKNDDELELLPAFDLQFVDIGNLDNDALFYYFERSSQVGLSRAAGRAARKIVTLKATDEDTQEMIMRAYVMLISSVPDHVEAAEISQEAREWCNAHQVADASILLTTLPRYLYAQDMQGFTSAIQDIQTRYGNNPEVMTHLTRMLIDFGILNPDGSPRRMPTTAPPADSAQLWTGDAATAPSIGSSGPAEPASPEGGSKLWLPGMD